METLEVDSKLVELAHDIVEITTLYIRDCSDKDSWIHYYVRMFKVKLPSLSLNESLEDFTKKLRKIFDFAQLSFYTVKVTGEKTYKERDHEWYKDLEKRIFDGLSIITEEQFEMVIKPFLKVNKFGQN